MHIKHEESVRSIHTYIHTYILIYLQTYLAVSIMGSKKHNTKR